MDPTELKDFETALRAHGYSAGDFEVSEVDQTTFPNAPVSFAPTKGEVIVERKSTQKKRSYKSDHGTRWVEDFTNELKQGFFN